MKDFEFDKHTTDLLLVGVDRSPGQDDMGLTVVREEGGVRTVMQTCTGAEAEQLYLKLLGIIRV